MVCRGSLFLSDYVGTNKINKKGPGIGLGEVMPILFLVLRCVDTNVLVSVVKI